MLCGLAERQTVENLVQMVGRATYNGASVRKRNLGAGAKVKVLIVWRDWDAAKAYYSFQSELFERFQPGNDMASECLSQAATRYSWRSNISNIGLRTVGAGKLKLRVDVGYEQTPAGGLAEDERGHFAGARWAEREGHPVYGRHGQLYKLCSPITMADREAKEMSHSGRVIEEYLYHAKHHSNPLALIIRRFLLKGFELGDAAVPRRDEDRTDDPAFRRFTEFECQSACCDLPVLSTSKQGDLEVKLKKKLWSRASACHTGAAKGRWRLAGLEWAPFRADSGGVSLNEEIVLFGKNFAAQILAQPPIVTEQGMQAFLVENAQDLEVL